MRFAGVLHCFPGAAVISSDHSNSLVSTSLAHDWLVEPILTRHAALFTLDLEDCEFVDHVRKMIAPSPGVSELRFVIDDADIAQCRGRLQPSPRKCHSNPKWVAGEYIQKDKRIGQA